MANEQNIHIKDTGSLNKVMETLERNAAAIAADAAQIKADAAEARAAAEAGKISAAKYDEVVRDLTESKATIESQAAVVRKLQERCDVLEQNQKRVSVLDEREYVPGFVTARGGLTRKQRDSVTTATRWLEDRIRVEMGAAPRHMPLSMFQLRGGQDESAPSGGVSKGGNLLPQEIFSEIQWLRDEYGVGRRDARVVQMTGPTLDIPTSTNAWTVEYPGELNAPSADTGSTIDDPKPRIDAKKCVAKNRISFELNQDAPQGFIDFIFEQAFETFGIEEDRVIFVTNNSPAGWYGALRAAGVNTHSLGGSSTSGKVSISQLAYDDFVDAMSKIDRRVHLTGKFYFSSYVQDVSRKIKDSHAQPLFAPMVVGAPATILGRPWEVVGPMPGIADNAVANNPFALYANLRRSVFFGVRHELEVAFSDHALFAEAGIMVRLLSRFGVKVVLPKAIVVVKTAAS